MMPNRTRNTILTTFAFPEPALLSNLPSFHRSSLDHPIP
jgi:hypothetical protein